MFRASLSAMLAVSCITVVAFGQSGGIQIDHAWSRAALAGHNGALFLTITDTGAPDRLTGVATPVAEMAEVHESYSDQGIMKMRPIATLPVAAGKPVTLAPGGYHIMLMHLKQPLRDGDTVPVTLTFEKAGAVTATAVVTKAGAPTMPSDHGMMDKPQR